LVNSIYFFAVEIAMKYQVITKKQLLVSLL